MLEFLQELNIVVSQTAKQAPLASQLHSVEMMNLVDHTNGNGKPMLINCIVDKFRLIPEFDI